MTTSKGIRESWSHSLYLRRKTSRRGEMDVQILCVRIGELPFDSLFQPDALDQPVIIALSSNPRTASVRLRNWSGTALTALKVFSP